MPRSEKHRKELQGFQSPLADMPGDMPHTLPEGYFRQVVEDVMAQIQADLTTSGAEDPLQEIEHLSPTLASAHRGMPFLKPDESTQPWQFVRQQTAEPANAQEPKQLHKTPVRRLPIVRAAAAFLALGTAAWLLQIQIATEVLPIPIGIAQQPTLELGTIEDANIYAFLNDTEVFTATESIGIEDTWADEAKDIASGERNAIDNELASLPEATLLAFTLETGLHTTQP